MENCLTQSAIENFRMYLPEISLAVQVIIAALIGFYAWQVKKSVDEIKKQRMSLFKPIVVCEGIDPQKNLPGVWLSNIRNYGKGPAFNISAKIEGAKYETKETGFGVLSEKSNQAGSLLILDPKDHEQRGSFELADDVKRGALIFTYQDIARNSFETRIELWKVNDKWSFEVMWAGKNL